MKCVVIENCKHRWECDWCEDYGQYQPEDRKILSPAQERRRLERREDKKALKRSPASAMGRRNKQAGKRAERDLEAIIRGWGYEAKRVPGSGAFKAVGVLGGQDNNLASDVEMYVCGEKFLVEVKKRADLNTYYNYAESGIYVTGFCYIVTEEAMRSFLNGCGIPTNIEIPDVRFKRLHDWFKQDNAEFVAMKMNRRPFIFAISLEGIKRIGKIYCI